MTQYQAVSQPEVRRATYTIVLANELLAMPGYETFVVEEETRRRELPPGIVPEIEPQDDRLTRYTWRWWLVVLPDVEKLERRQLDVEQSAEGTPAA